MALRRPPTTFSDDITAGDLAANSVGASELADNAVDSDAIAANAVVTAKIADSSSTTTGITPAKIAENAVTSAKIATGAVIADGIGAGAVVEAGLGAGAVTSAKMGDVIEVNPHIIPGVLYPSYVASGTGNKLLDGTTAHSGAFGTVQSDGRSYYHTNIAGSKPIKDPRIGTHFGAQRHYWTSGQFLEEESAEHGQNTYSIDGREWMRVTSSSSLANLFLNNLQGNGIQIGWVDTEFIEVTGYFNNINVLGLTWIASSYGVKYSINGAAFTTASDDFNVAINSPIKDRFVRSGSLLNLPVSATLGINTVKISMGGAAYGIELIAQDTQDFTATNATNILTSAGHTLSNGDQIRLIGSDLPNGLNATTTYFVIGASGNNFQVATTSTGSAVTFSDDGSGSRTFRSLNTIQIPAQNVVSYGKKFSVSAAAHHYNPFAYAADSTTAVAIGNAGAHGKVATGWSGTTAGHFDSTLDTATSLGLAAWENGGNFYRPIHGGRIVKWIDSSGNIKTSVNMMPPAGTGIGNATGTNTPVAENWTTRYQPVEPHSTTIDHSQAEIAKTFDFREWGNGSSNGNSNWTDVSTMTNADNQDIVYVMDDGLTSFYGHGAYYESSNGGGLIPYQNDDNFYMTFIGTGITLKTECLPAAGYSATIFQNLPYGTHILKSQRVNGGPALYWIDGIALGSISNATYGGFSEMTFYQPKMPPIPENAVVIADYMLMADFVPQTAVGLEKISKGVRTCSISRDLLANGPSGHSWNFSKNTGYYDGFVIYGSADANGTNYTYRIPSFCTNWVVKSRHSASITLYNGSSASGTQTAGTNNVAGAYRHLTNDVPLGLQNSGWNPNASQNPMGHAMEFASPTHTSSHYQKHEGPFTYELVGGDRNMEQTNLVVTADGKSWDEVTRDTSYLGPKYHMHVFGTDNAGGNLWTNMNFFRGHKHFTMQAVEKGIYRAGDKFRVPQDGYYSIQGYFRMDTTVDEKWVAIYSDAQTLIRAWIMGEALDGDKDGITVSGIHFFRRSAGYRLHSNVSPKAEAGEYNHISISWVGGR